MTNRIFMIFLMLMTMSCNISMPINWEWYEDEKGILYTEKRGILIPEHLLQENIKLGTKARVQTLLKN